MGSSFPDLAKFLDYLGFGTTPVDTSPVITTKLRCQGASTVTDPEPDWIELKKTRFLKTDEPKIVDCV